MTKFCFDVLKIAPTTDKDTIKKAYRKLLHHVNPEDDMQGFQNLRAAYEDACAFAERQTAPEKHSLSEQFIEKCQNLYNNFFLRIQTEEWEALFDDPVCMNLETGEAIRKAFLTFLMEHFHFPDEVWHRIDSTFAISGNRKELSEWFPVDYVDYLQQVVREKGLIAYPLFEGEEKEFDVYIDGYIALRQHMDFAMFDQAKEDIRALEKLEVYHPYVEVEKARLLLQEKKDEEAGALLRKLGEKYDTEERIQCMLGQYLQKEGCWEELRGLYDRVLQQYPDSVMARGGKAEELLHDGNYLEARQMILDLLEDNPQDEKLMQDLVDANGFMIEELENKKKAGTCSQDDEMELGWCYYQNMRLEDAIALLDGFTPDEEHEMDYHNLKGRVYLTMDENEKALEHLEPWLRALLLIRPDGTKKTNRRLARLGYAYYTIGAAKAALLLKNGGEDFSEVMEYMEKAVKFEKEESQRVSYYHTMADIWRQQKAHGKVVDVCDKILQENQGYYPAVLMRQEACLHLGMYQAVADDYQRAVQMYPYFGKPYATLMKMYFLFDEYEKVREILELTKVQKIESDELCVLDARYRAVTADSRQDFETALKMLDGLKARGWKSSSDLSEEDWKEIDYWRSIIYMDLDCPLEARQAMEESLEGGGDNVERMLSYVVMLVKCEDYDAAIKWLKEAMSVRPEDKNIWYKIGWCYKMKKEYEKALCYMKKVLKAYPEHPAVRYVIADIYERMARREENNSYYEEALSYMKEQVDQFPEEYYLIELGLLYLDMDRYEEALEYFYKAKLKNPQSVYACNNAGNCYLSMNMPKKAEPLFREAVRYMMEEDKTALPYNNLAKCYRIMNRYEDARKCYEKNLELFPKHADIYLLMGGFFRENKEYEKAVVTYRKGMERSEEKKSLELELFRTLGMEGEEELVEKMGKKLREKYAEDPILFQLTGEVYLFGLEKWKEAEGYLKTALLLAEKQKDMEGIRGSLYLLGRCCFLMHKEEKGRYFFQRFLDVCRGTDGKLRQYENFYGERGRRRFRIGCTLWFMGRLKEAEECFRSMDTERCRCDGCSKPFCYEKIIGEAMMLWVSGEKEKALRLYEKSVEFVPDDMEHRFEYRQMKKMEEPL